LLRIGVLASGRGSNLQALVDGCALGRIQGRVVVVISNNSRSGALARAAASGIPGCHLSSHTHPGPGELDFAICGALQQHACDLVALAGYMKQLGPHTLRAFRGRVVNVHPALLPRHGGTGMYGMRVHEAVLASQDAYSGATIHLVTGEYDQGPVLAQCRVPVLPGDTPESLAARVLAVEHELYVNTVAAIARGEMSLPIPG
jgi:phosphoribosylglycinamide formyltransferase-1